MLHEISQKLGMTGRTTKDLQDLLKETRIDELAELAEKLDGALPSE
jgi:hypothetical protein